MRALIVVVIQRQLGKAQRMVERKRYFITVIWGPEFEKGTIKNNDQSRKAMSISHRCIKKKLEVIHKLNIFYLI